jgi:16S rRNA (adenine1518-N6/adenine1519-N6)-dimethyltransferase
LSRQRFGQHFLSSSHILERIAAAACGEHAGTVIEIGPGRGALTTHLLARADRLIAIEIDPELAAGIRVRFAGEPRLTVIEGDALKQDFREWAPDVICGNLPYYAATPILERSVRLGVRTVALIQREVADRLTAQPGTREYGYLTCSVALYAQARFLFGVKPGSFQPPPKVDSAVVAFEPNTQLAALGVDAQPFLSFLAACFHLKRKTLRNNLAGQYGREVLDALPEASLRAEQCSLEALAALYRRLNPA